MNLIFPLIAVLFFFCILTVIKLKKTAVRFNAIEGQPFRIQVTDRTDLNVHDKYVQSTTDSKNLQSTHEIQINLTMDGKTQNLLQGSYPEQNSGSQPTENHASNMIISVNLLK